MKLLKIACIGLLALSPLSVSAADTAAFDAFGGKAGLDRLTADLVPTLFDSPEIGVFFKDSNPDRIRQMLAEQFCVELSGPCRYTGIDMRKSHARFDIRTEHFNILVELLQEAMDRQGVPFWAQNKLLARLAPMHKDIINNAEKVPK